MIKYSEILQFWYHENKRDLPWRNTSNPFYIWLSEIILQQTRVAQGLSYYEKFIGRFEKVKDLAEASEDEVLALWKGLGYYSRGRNLRKAAIQIQEDFGGEFPKDFESLKKLKGVGDYSAAAIASFAYKEKVAVVDGNVYRVLSRLFNIDTPIDTTQGKKDFVLLANEIISSKHPDIHNQAIMEFGALQCVPKNPNCDVCPFLSDCEARKANRVGELPVKSKKIKRRSRYFDFYWMEKEGRVAIQKRGEKDIWANMFQFPLVEHCEAINVNAPILWETKHVLTHQDLHCRFIKSADFNGEFEWVSMSEFENLAFPRVIENFLERYKP